MEEGHDDMEEKKMTNKRINVLLSTFVGIVCLFFPVNLISASAIETLQVEATSYVVSSQWVPVGDEAGHVIGVQQREGDHR